MTTRSTSDGPYPYDKAAEHWWERGYTNGTRDMLTKIAHDLDEISDDDGSLSGGDCVEYIYKVLEGAGVVESCENCGVTHPVGPCRFCQLQIELPADIEFENDNIVGTRADLLLLARTIHDIIEGSQLIDHLRPESHPVTLDTQERNT